MAITEKSRHELYRRLEEILGPEEATTLMEHLPPVGWADVATKEDLRQLEGRLDAKFDVIEARFEAVDSRFEIIDERFDALESRLSGPIDVLGEKIETTEHRLLAEMHSTLRSNAYLTLGAMAALVTLISALAALT